MYKNTKLILHGVVGICIGCANFFGGISWPIWLIWVILIPSGIRYECKVKGIWSWYISIMMGISVILAVFYLKIGVLLFTILLLGEYILIVRQRSELNKREADQTVDCGIQSMSQEDRLGQEVNQKERGFGWRESEMKKETAMNQNAKLILHGIVGFCIGCANLFGSINWLIWFIWLFLIPYGVRYEWKVKGIWSWCIYIMMGISVILAVFYLKIGLLLFTILLLGEDILSVWQRNEKGASNV